MNRAVFFDRDGVINNDDGFYYVFNPEDFSLNPGVIELLTWLKSENFLLLIVSNQGGISRGIYTKADTERVHAKMNSILNEYDLRFDEIYYCPHHPDNQKCLCRKPGIVQIEKAIARFSIDAKNSFFIGDRDTDVETGKKAGLIPVLVERNQDMRRVIGIIKELSGIS